MPIPEPPRSSPTAPRGRATDPTPTSDDTEVEPRRKGYRVHLSADLTARLAAASRRTGHSSARLANRGIITLLDRLDAATTNPDAPWPWHALTMSMQPDLFGILPDSLCGELRCPLECSELPAWASCWARHDNHWNHYWPHEPGEYRIRPCSYTDGGDEDGPNIVEELQTQIRDAGGSWVDYEWPFIPIPEAPGHRVTVTRSHEGAFVHYELEHTDACHRLPYGQQCDIEKEICAAGVQGLWNLQNPGTYNARPVGNRLPGLHVKPWPAEPSDVDQAVIGNA